MKALSGGLITNAALAFAFLRQFSGIVPIWGIQYEHELDEFISLEKQPPQLDTAMLQAIERSELELVGDFVAVAVTVYPARLIFLYRWRLASRCCSGRRISSMLRHLGQESMARINDCIECGHCKAHCPYNPDTPAIASTAGAIPRFRK